MISPVSFSCLNTGSLIKQSKKHFRWEFYLDGTLHVITLEFSVLSRKRRVLVDGLTKHESTVLDSLFQYPFTLMGSSLNIIQSSDTQVELRINNQSFQHMLSLMKQQQEFKYESDEDKQDNTPQPSRRTPIFDKQEPKLTLKMKNKDIGKSFNFQAEDPFKKQDDFTTFNFQQPKNNTFDFVQEQQAHLIVDTPQQENKHPFYAQNNDFDSIFHSNKTVEQPWDQAQPTDSFAQFNSSQWDKQENQPKITYNDESKLPSKENAPKKDLVDLTSLDFSSCDPAQIKIPSMSMPPAHKNTPFDLM